MSDDSKRLATLKALTLHLEERISISNGYNHDLRGSVFRGRMWFDDTDPLPMVSIIESPNPDRFPSRAGVEDQIDEVDQKEHWIIFIQGWTQDDKRNPTDNAYELMADVKKALALLNLYNPEKNEGLDPNYLLGGLILSLEFEPGTVRPPDDQSGKAFFWMRLILEFVENVNDPFDQS